MEWFTQLLWPEYGLAPGTHPQPIVVVASTTLILASVACVGLMIGSIKYKGLGLGISGVLFAGLLFGHLGLKINEEILHFARDFGLILFVYTIGMQVGPGFFASLRKNGLPLNLMAASIVLLGALTTVGLWKAFMRPEDLPAAVGLLSGGVTNTPSLAAAKGALEEMKNRADAKPETAGKITPAQLAMPGQAYAVAYPFGIMGIILTMILIKRFARVDLAAEQEAFAKLSGAGKQKLEAINLEVSNPNLAGRKLSEVPMLDNSGVVISRLLRGGKAAVAGPHSILEAGDVLLAVGPYPKLVEFKLIVGKESVLDARTVPSEIVSRRVLVTQKAVAGKALDELHLRERFGVNVTRIHRNEVELPVTDNVRLQFGDNVVVVGDKQTIQAAAQELGDSPKHLDHPQIIPIFLGIALGVVLGMVPIALPGVPVPVKLGLAGGPLIVAILLSRLGRLGPFVWYMPLSANFMLREVGIVLFLACVGVASGATFAQSIKVNGLQWFAFGAAITFLPLIIVGAVARVVFKVNFMTLCGLLAGSMTDPPALSFATSITGSEAPSIGYATVYPLTMLLRVFTAQVIVLTLM